MYDYQGMVILAANQVWWTWEVEDVFRKVKKGDKMGMKNYAKKLHSQIDDLVVQVGWPLTRLTSLSLTLSLSSPPSSDPLHSFETQTLSSSDL